MAAVAAGPIPAVAVAEVSIPAVVAEGPILAVVVGLAVSILVVAADAALARSTLDELN